MARTTKDATDAIFVSSLKANKYAIAAMQMYRGNDARVHRRVKGGAVLGYVASVRYDVGGTALWKNLTNDQVDRLVATTELQNGDT